MSRSPNLNKNTVLKIAKTVSEMLAPITWHRVIAAVRAETGFAYTRQALSKHPQVLVAFQDRKHRAASNPQMQPLSSAVRATKRAALKQKTEIETLRATLWRYEEMFIIILNNAYALNISEQRLLRPLSAIAQHTSTRKSRA